MAKQNKDTRTRSWLCVVYPDSLPVNWKDILIEEYQIEWICSPLHEFDVNPDGEKKKPHYHLLLINSFDAPYREELKYIVVPEVLNHEVLAESSDAPI